MRTLLPSIALALVACTSDASGPEGALEQALAHARPGATGDRAASPTRTPPTRVEASLTLTFVRPDGSYSLAMHRTIDRQDGRFRVVDERAFTAPSVVDPKVPLTRREVVESRFDGAAFAWRRGTGQWIERDARDGLPQATLDEALGLGTFALDAFGDYLVPTPRAPDVDHPPSLGGVAARWSSLALDPQIRPRALSPEDLTALRDHEPTVAKYLAATHRPTQVHGLVARATPAAAAPTGGLPTAGRVLAIELDLEGQASFDEGTSPFSLALSQKVLPLPDDVAFDLPAERLPDTRERPWKMIEDVLGERLLPPYAH